VNASRFGKRISGCGGFINISQNSRKVVFLGTFTAGGLTTDVRDGKIAILTEGRHRKFVDKVGQITFSGALAAERDKEVLYVTERCVFALRPDGLELIEVAPGIDLDKDILALMPFQPRIDTPKIMEAALFGPEPLGLRDRMLDIHIEDRLSYDPDTNTVFMNFAGMRVRNAGDIQRIKDAVEGLLEPLGKRVYSIVNYDSFAADDDALDGYMDLVRYVEKKYYLGVSRYTTSGFMRLKLGRELEKRKVSSQVFESGREAQDHLR
jgi:propionate CoA-transferase